MPFRAAILTVSDKGARGEREDTSGAAIRELLQTIDVAVERYEIIPDELSLISERLSEWADADRLDLIMTTGGNIAALEDQINDIVGAKVLVWESELSAKLQHFRMSTFMIILLSVGSSLLIVAYSIYDVYRYYGGWVFWLEFLVVSGSTLIALIFLFRLGGLHSQTKKFIKEKSARSAITKESLE